MTRWHLHSLNARNALTLLLPALRATGNRAVALAGAAAVLPPFDLVVRAGAQGSAPMARATAPGVIDLILDPARWDEGRVLRLLLPALMQMMRLDGPGPAVTLGETLVERGLAGHFVVQVLGDLPGADVPPAPAHGLAGRALRDWGARDFDPGLWFDGTGDLPPRAGQDLAFALISRHFARHPDATAGSLAREGAETFRATLRAMTVGDGMKPAGRTPTERPG